MPSHKGFCCRPCFIYFLLFLFFCLLEPHVRHLEVPRQSYSCQPTPQPHRIQAPSETHTTALQQHQIPNPLSEARDQTRILMDTCWVHHCWAMMGTPPLFLDSLASNPALPPGNTLTPTLSLSHKVLLNQTNLMASLSRVVEMKIMVTCSCFWLTKRTE